MTYVSQFQTTVRSQLKNKQPNKRREEEYQNLHYFKPKNDGFPLSLTSCLRYRNLSQHVCSMTRSVSFCPA